MEVHEQDGAFAGAHFHMEEERSDRPNLRDSVGKKTFRPGDTYTYIHTYIHTYIFILCKELVEFT